MAKVPEQRSGESELDFLRRKEKFFGLWQGDALERIRDLEADLAPFRNVMAHHGIAPYAKPSRKQRASTEPQGQAA